MHWRVKIRWVKSGEMTEPGNYAEVQHNPMALRADILVQYPDDYVAQDRCFHHDDKSIESSVVHELLHLVLSSVGEWLDDDGGSDLERAVVTLERAFCEE